MRQTIILLSLLVPLTLLTACSGNSKQKEEAKINAAVVAELGDVLKSDFNDAISRIDHSGMYSRDDVFGNSHDFTSKERALNYITSINGATLFVMDSLQLQIEEAAVNNESDRQLDKLNKLVKKYIDVCRHPAAAPDKLLKTCKSISDAIRETIKVAGNPDEKAVKDRIGLCGAAVMRRELAAAQKASDANAEKAAKWRKEGEAFLQTNAKKPGVRTTADGLQYKEIVRGSGITPGSNSTVVVEYEGRLTDGTVFDSSAKQGHGGRVTLNVSSVMRGWSEALQMMKKGSEWELYIPAELAYGEEGEGNVPPSATLIFKLKLIDVK